MIEKAALSPALVPLEDVALETMADARQNVSMLSKRPRPGPAPEIVLDLSRLLSRMRFSAPTGVDRVEMAYAEQLLALAPDRLSFSAIHPMGVYGRLRKTAVIDFLRETASNWKGGAQATASARLQALIRLTPQSTPRPSATTPRSRVYLQVSPHHLDKPDRVRTILARENARFVCLIHDLIPIEYPEHARPDGPEKHRRRMRTLADTADALIATTDAMRQSYLKHTGDQGKAATVRVSPLGAGPRRSSVARLTEASPYFVMLGTIEPRKNHLLLLNLWRRMVEELGAKATPRLILIGRRGWENENILDMLDRCPALKDVVEEHGHLPDAKVWPLLQDAKALLNPSFTEGFGLPVIEALQMSVPVLCSDIAAHREIAGAAAEFLDPLDGPAWRRAILDYAAPGSSRRAGQLERIRHWRAPTWESHVRAALDLVDEVGR